MPEKINQRINKSGLDGLTKKQLGALLNTVLIDLTALQTQFNQLRADFNAHSHGGVTAGAANTSVVAASTSTAVTLQLSQ